MPPASGFIFSSLFIKHLKRACLVGVLMVGNGSNHLPAASQATPAIRNFTAVKPDPIPDLVSKTINFVFGRPG
jgi:hypothetical protein